MSDEKAETEKPYVPDHNERRPWSQTVKSTAVEMAYADPVDLHGKLTAAGWTAEEAHFILAAAAFYVDQKAQAAE